MCFLVFFRDFFPGILTHKITCVYSGIFSGIFSGLFSGIFSGIFSGKISGIFSGIWLSCIFKGPSKGQGPIRGLSRAQPRAVEDPSKTCQRGHPMSVLIPSHWHAAGSQSSKQGRHLHAVSVPFRHPQGKRETHPNPLGSRRVRREMTAFFLTVILGSPSFLHAHPGERNP